MNVELAQALLAGWLSGAAAGLAITALLLISLTRHPEAAARLPLQARLRVASIVVANGLVFLFTLVGLLAGAMYERISSDSAGGRFALAVAGACLALAALYVFVRGGVRAVEAPVVLGALLVLAVAFGVMLPLLAGMSA